MKEFQRNVVRPVALTIFAPIAGFTLLFLAEILLKIEVPMFMSAVINLLVVAPIAFLVFPRFLGIPFGRTDSRTFFQKTGFFWPENAWRHILLGLFFAACTFTGMLLASILTGRYRFDPGTINLPHFVFNLNPALWEELFHRGVLMLLLLKFTKSLTKAAGVQIVLFGLTHIKGIGFWNFVDVFSVMIIAVGFTYLAFKTRSLVAGITFHFFHNAFLFTVQPSGGNYTGVTENLIFYGLLWSMVGVGCVITRFAAERGGVSSPNNIYPSESIQTNTGMEVAKGLHKA